MGLDKFERLEKEINGLIKAYESVKAENTELRKEIASKTGEVEGLKAKISQLDREKGLVRERVDALIDRLDSLIQGA
jgi:predicted  nucleic acid-binding Zn-ribbon protein